jgi:diadenylate cyclase
VAERGSHPLTDALALVAPGTALREALDRILQAQRGALIVIGDSPEVLSICTGGFLLDAEFTPQRLSELAKMDGAIILAANVSRIARANVHMMPKASVPTSETGTRHRSAERVARSIDVPVITVSEAMSTIAVYRNDYKHTIHPTGWLVDRAGQAVLTLQRFRARFDFALLTLSTLEVEDTVSVRDVVAVLQPGEMLRRIADEVEGYLVELGDDGRLINLQLEELLVGRADAMRRVVQDFVVHPQPPAGGLLDGKVSKARAAARHKAPAPGAKQKDKGHAAEPDDADEPTAAALKALERLGPEDLHQPTRVAAALGLGSSEEGLDHGIEARGYRLLHRLPRISDHTIDRIVERFGSLPGLLQASVADLEQVSGVGSAKARAVKEGLARLVEASILERYE